MRRKSNLLPDPNRPKSARIFRRSAQQWQPRPSSGLLTFPPRRTVGGRVTKSGQQPVKAGADANFEYIITAEGVTVERLIINSVRFDDPGEHGHVFAPVFVDTIQVVVDATLFNPVGSGSLQLKFFGQNVFSEPQLFEFNTSGGGGLNLANVPLPL